MRPFFTFLILFVLGIGVAFPQQTEEEQTYLKPLYESWEAYPYLSKEDKEAIKLWEGEYRSFFTSLDYTQQQASIDLYEQAVRKKIALYPAFYDWTKVQQLVFRDYASLYGQVFSSVRQLLKKGKPKEFHAYIMGLQAFFKDRVLNSTVAATWKVDQLPGHIDTLYPPKVAFEEVNLVCTAYNDSICIERTSGEYHPLQNEFRAHGGKSYFTRVGLSKDSCYFQYKDYTVNLKRNVLQVDSVFFYNLSLYPQPFLGSMEDKILAVKDLKNAAYPRFSSYQNRIFFEKIFDYIDIQAPLVQQGTKIIFGNKEHIARMFVSKRDTLYSLVETKSLVMNEQGLVSPLAKFILYLDKDSLYNNAVDVKYFKDKQIFQVGNSAQYEVSMPFINTYHKLRMNFESLRWNIPKDTIDIGLIDLAGREGVVSYKSLDVFSVEEFASIWYGGEINPLYTLKKYSERVRSRRFPVSDYAGYLNYDQDKLRVLLLNLASLGFLYYDKEMDEVDLLDQLYHYLEVSAKTRDFDVIEMQSLNQQTQRAHLSLRTFDLYVEGIEKLLFSRKQNVYIYPKQGKIKIMKNRDMVFNGQLHAGRFDFFVKAANFDYQAFKINLGIVDTLSFSISKANEDGTFQSHPVSSLIKSLAGVLYIDDSNNRGGIKDYADYPIYVNEVPSYVTYDLPEIQGGVYSADSFYFEIDPFALKKLNTFNVDSIQFPGTLVSYGIFPDLRETLRIMPDNSLGFVSDYSATPLSLYGGMAKLYHQVRLDHRGLVADGKIEFLNSTIRSSHIDLLPASAHGLATSFTTREYQNATRSYPLIESEKVQIDLYADQRFLEMTSPSDSNTRFYSTQWPFHGKYFLSETQSFGKGVMRVYGQSRLESPKIDLSKSEFVADSAYFLLNTPDFQRKLLEVDRQHIQVDVNQLLLQASSYEETNPVFFPLNHFETETEHFRWNMPEARIFFQHKTNNEPVYFHATKPQMDSLKFLATQTYFLYEDTLLNVKGVKQIEVADALITPENENLKVMAYGRMKKLENARLVFPKDMRWHEFYRVGVEILSGKKYRGEGLYQYKSEGLSAQVLNFEKISSVDEGYSEASGWVSKSEGTLALNPAFEYLGKVRLRSVNPRLFLDGQLRMKYVCDNLVEDETLYEEEEEKKTSRKRGRRSEEREKEQVDTAALALGDFEDGLKFSAYVNPDSVVIPITSSTRSPLGPRLKSGFYSRYLYYTPKTVFLQSVRTQDMPLLVVDSGYLQFNEVTQKYEILDSEGELLVEKDPRRCEIYSKGEMDFHLRGHGVDWKMYGDMLQKEKGGYPSFEMDVALAVDFYFPKELLDRMAEVLNMNTDATGFDLAEDDNFDGMLQSSLSDKVYRTVYSEIQERGTYSKVPVELEHNFLFSGVNLTWEPGQNAYVSQERANLVSVGSHTVNKKIKVYIRVSRNRRGDKVDMYFESTRLAWFYFSYDSRYMQVYSSDDKFNTMLYGIKASKKKKGNFEFYLSTLRKKNSFVESFENSMDFEEGVEEDYSEDEVEEESETEVEEVVEESEESEETEEYEEGEEYEEVEEEE